jgi:hypothetical protein
MSDTSSGPADGLTPEEAIRRLLAFLAGRTTSHFWGVVRVRFQDGKVVKVTVEQDFLPGTLPRGASAKTGDSQ